MNYIEKEIHRKEWKETLKQNNPQYLVTVTLRKEVSVRESEDTVKFLLTKIRNQYFGRNPKRQFISGYLIIEHQRSGRPHYHILFQDHTILRRADRNFREVVREKCHTLSLIDENKGVDIQDYYEGCLEGYLTKSIEYEQDNFDFIHPLTYEGF